MSVENEPCLAPPDDEVFTRYLRGQLSDEEAATFERHYLDCPSCFETLELHRAVARGLSEGASIVPFRVKRAGPRRQVVWGLATAAAIVVAVLVMRRSAEAPAPTTFGATATVRPEPSTTLPTTTAAAPAPAPAAKGGDAIAQLARFDPPGFIAPALRGPATDNDRAFVLAMASYVGGNYAAAREALRPVAAADPQSAGASFFLAITELLLDHTGDGIGGLRHTIALGDTPYLEDAHFYLSKALLRIGDVAGAKQELTAAVRMNGDRRAESAALLEQLRGLR